MDTKLDAVQNALDDVNENNDVAAINALEAFINAVEAFINAVEAQSGKKLDPGDAGDLIAAAQGIIDLLV